MEETIVWNNIASVEDLPKPGEEKLWALDHIHGSVIGNLETTRCFVQDVQFHGSVPVEHALAWTDVPVYKGRRRSGD